MTAAADIQIAVLNNFSVITVDFRTGGILAVNGGFAVVVCRGVITINLGAGATVGLLANIKKAGCTNPTN
ncbi:hypothetical protein [Escherichia coli]|uniref:hypothetical protein n=1 Tax=Escherichia coli TaxID=562 RepID=UPI0038560F31